MWRPGQCVVIVHNHLLQVMYSSLWLDSLFVSLQPTNQTGVLSAAALITVGDNNATTNDTVAASGALWLTRSVVSGDTDAGGTSGVRTAVSVQLGSSAALHGVVRCPPPDVVQAWVAVRFSTSVTPRARLPVPRQVLQLLPITKTEPSPGQAAMGLMPIQ